MYHSLNPGISVGIGGVAPLPIAPLPVAPLPIVPIAPSPLLPLSAPMTVDITIPSTFDGGLSLTMDVNASSVFIHPDFNPATLANDIALIRLPYPAPLPSVFQFAQIPRPIGSFFYTNIF